MAPLIGELSAKQTERFCIYTLFSSFILHNCLQFGFNLMEFLHNT